MSEPANRSYRGTHVPVYMSREQDYVLLHFDPSHVLSAIAALAVDGSVAMSRETLTDMVAVLGGQVTWDDALEAKEPGHE